MTKRKGIRLLAALALCFALCISFTVPAFAYADDTEQELPVTEATQPEAKPETAAPEEPEQYEGEPIDSEGNAYTRDLLYDKATNKQFITVQTKTGNTFYVVIDYDAPINEEEEQYQTYFLNMVDEADLLALLDEETASSLTTCNCDTRCEAGAVNTECPVCKTNMSECTGAVPEPEEPVEGEETEVPEEPENASPNIALIIGIIALVGIRRWCILLHQVRFAARSRRTRIWISSMTRVMRKSLISTRTKSLSLLTMRMTRPKPQKRGNDFDLSDCGKTSVGAAIGRCWALLPVGRLSRRKQLHRLMVRRSSCRACGRKLLR